MLDGDERGGLVRETAWLRIDEKQALRPGSDEKIVHEGVVPNDRETRQILEPGLSPATDLARARLAHERCDGCLALNPGDQLHLLAIRAVVDLEARNPRANAEDAKGDRRSHQHPPERNRCRLRFADR